MTKTKKIRAGLAICLLAVVGPCVTAAHAQQTTEQFIPIGMSPGVSGKSSYIGSIIAVDEDGQKVSLRSDSGARTLKISASTRIWLDRSKSGKSSVEGGFGDLRTGLRIEALPSGEDSQTAAWVKIETSQ